MRCLVFRSSTTSTCFNYFHYAHAHEFYNYSIIINSIRHFMNHVIGDSCTFQLLGIQLLISIPAHNLPHVVYACVVWCSIIPTGFGQFIFCGNVKLLLHLILKCYHSQWEEVTVEDAARIKWVPDYAALNCHLCNSDFSVLNRKHHCR